MARGRTGAAGRSGRTLPTRACSGSASRIAARRVDVARRISVLPDGAELEVIRGMLYVRWAAGNGRLKRSLSESLAGGYSGTAFSSASLDSVAKSSSDSSDNSQPSAQSIDHSGTERSSGESAGSTAPPALRLQDDTSHNPKLGAEDTALVDETYLHTPPPVASNTSSQRSSRDSAASTAETDAFASLSRSSTDSVASTETLTQGDRTSTTTYAADRLPTRPIRGSRGERRTTLCVEDWFDYSFLRAYHGPATLASVVALWGCAVAARKKGAPLCLVVDRASPLALNAVLMAGTLRLLLVEGPRTRRMEAVRRAERAVRPLVRRLRVRAYKTEGDAVPDDVPLRLRDCLRAAHVFVHRLRLVDWRRLDVAEAERLSCVEHGDMSWVVPGRILALAAPAPETFTAAELAEYALANNVCAVVRLNGGDPGRAAYAPEVLRGRGVAHHDIPYPDGDTPTPAQVRAFLGIADAAWDSGRALAVHCYAGLGRTGTMLACFFMRRWGVAAADAVAFLRMMRPGSVLGGQARFLADVQTEYVDAGAHAALYGTQ